MSYHSWLLVAMIPFLSLNASAQGVPNESLLEPGYSTNAKVNEIVTYRAKANHHFNLKAPQKCGDQKPVEMKPEALKCQFHEPGKKQVRLKICDDKETFCKDERVELEVTGPPQAKADKSKANAIVYRPIDTRPIPTGFIANDPAKALKQAQATGKLMLIDFYGIWCPPCNMLDELVFEQASFLAASKDLVKVRLDGDSDLSWEWRQKFKIRGYPTLILANSKLEEIGRVVGYRSVGFLNEWLEQGKTLKNESVEQAEKKLASKLGTDPESLTRRKRVGLWYLERGENEKAVRMLDGLPGEEERLAHLTASLEDAKTKKLPKTEMAKLLKSALDQFPNEVEFGSWLSSLIEISPVEAKPYLEKLDQNLASLKGSKRLDRAGYVEGDLWSIAASDWEDAGQAEKAKAAYLKAADAYGEMAAQSHLKTSRGPGLERAYSLYKGGKLEDAEKLYQSMIQAYPEEYTFHYYYSRTLMDLKKLDKALEHATKAETYSYGDNWLKSVQLKAKILMALNRFDDAKSLLEKALAKTHLPKSNEIGTHRHYARMRDMLKEVEAQRK